MDRSYDGFVTNLQKEQFISSENKSSRKENACVLCGSTENLELHRIHPPKIESRKIPKGDYNRKVITLCMECHRSSTGIHGTKNKYKDINLVKLNKNE